MGKTKDQIYEEQTIHAPWTLSLEKALEFSKELRELPYSEKLKIDFSRTDLFRPSGMLFAAIAINEEKKSREHTEFQFINHGSRDSHGYAAHLGFFQMIGADYGKKIGEAWGSTTYVPVKEFDINQIRREANMSYQDYGEAAENEAAKLANVLTQSSSGDINQILRYSMREIIRNAVEHSQGNKVYICAQFTPSNSNVEVCILDNGVGIRQSLARNKELDFAEDKDALILSIMPGISGSAHFPSQAKREEWANSGWGLFMTSNIAKKAGSFFLGSKSAAVKIDASGKSYDENINCIGTVVRMKLNVNLLESFASTVGALEEEGRRLAEIWDGAVKTPSKASSMLTDFFRE